MTSAKRDPCRVSDESLMERYADGDSDAFDELFRRYEPRAFSYFLKRTRSWDRSQDLYQELFLRVHRGRATYDPARAFAPWFFQIAQRLLIDDARRAQRTHELTCDDVEDLGAPTRIDLVAERDQVGHLLGSLSDDERYILIAAKTEGAGYPEIAARLGKSVDAVKQMASRAMRRLRGGSGVTALALFESAASSRGA